MSGEGDLAVFTKRLKEKGITRPKDNVWKHAKRQNIEAAVHATFSMLGSVRAMARWASGNPTQFFSADIKLALAESMITRAGNIFLNTAVLESALDAVEVDSMGHFKRFKDIDE
jgi:hypothetical protein